MLRNRLTHVFPFLKAGNSSFISILAFRHYHKAMTLRLEIQKEVNSDTYLSVTQKGHCSAQAPTRPSEQLAQSMR